MTWLVLPTFNEAGNVERLVRDALANLPPSSRILVVDDNSPDGTGEIADRMSAELPVEVLHRPGKEGLASAYIAGFRYVLERGADLVLQMDADFSHDPTGGFKCFRRRVLESIDFERISSQGYAFQVEMTYRAMQAGFKVLEIPIVFRDRRVGSSKMSRAIVFEAVWRVPLLRRRRRVSR